MTLRKVIIAILIVLGLALLVAGLSLLVRPDWFDVPAGVLILIGVAFLAIAGLGPNLKGWVELLFGKDEKTSLPPQPTALPVQNQKIVSSPGAEQQMLTSGGFQKQEMSDSPDAKQTIK
jgi:hypothetical protein